MQFERYRLFVRHHSSDGRLASKWFEEIRNHEVRLGAEGWRLVSVNALVDDDGALVEILWFERLIDQSEPSRLSKSPLGFSYDSPNPMDES